MILVALATITAPLMLSVWLLEKLPIWNRFLPTQSHSGDNR